MYYIKWKDGQTSYDIWRGPNLGCVTMNEMGYERVEILPPVPATEIPLENLVFSKYKVAQKLK